MRLRMTRPRPQAPGALNTARNKCLLGVGTGSRTKTNLVVLVAGQPLSKCSDFCLYSMRQAPVPLKRHSDQLTKVKELTRCMRHIVRRKMIGS